MLQKFEGKGYLTRIRGPRSSADVCGQRLPCRNLMAAAIYKIRGKRLSTGIREKRLSAGSREKRLSTLSRGKLLSIGIREKRLSAGSREKRLSTLRRRTLLSTGIREKRLSAGSSSSNWILMSCQPHRVASGLSDSGHKQTHISKLFSHIRQPSLKSIYKTSLFANIKYTYKQKSNTNFRRVSPFNITTVKRAHKARACRYCRPFRLIYRYQVNDFFYKKEWTDTI